MPAVTGRIPLATGIPHGTWNRNRTQSGNPLGEPDRGTKGAETLLPLQSSQDRQLSTTPSRRISDCRCNKKPILIPSACLAGVLRADPQNPRSWDRYPVRLCGLFGSVAFSAFLGFGGIFAERVPRGLKAITFWLQNGRDHLQSWGFAF